VKEVLSQRNIKYAYVDITSGMFGLKNFLKIRDNNESHAKLRVNGLVGIPTLVVDDKSYLISGPEAMEHLVEELEL